MIGPPCPRLSACSVKPPRRCRGSTGKPPLPTWLAGVRGQHLLAARTLAAPSLSRMGRRRQAPALTGGSQLAAAPARLAAAGRAAPPRSRSQPPRCYGRSLGVALILTALLPRLLDMTRCAACGVLEEDTSPPCKVGRSQPMFRSKGVQTMQSPTAPTVLPAMPPLPDQLEVICIAGMPAAQGGHAHACAARQSLPKQPREQLPFLQDPSLIRWSTALPEFRSIPPACPAGLLEEGAGAQGGLSVGEDKVPPHLAFPSRLPSLPCSALQCPAGEQQPCDLTAAMHTPQTELRMLSAAGPHRGRGAAQGCPQRGG